MLVATIIISNKPVDNNMVETIHPANVIGHVHQRSVHCVCGTAEDIFIGFLEIHQLQMEKVSQ